MQSLLREKQKYESMFWAKYHECEKLKRILKENNLYYKIPDTKKDPIDGWLDILENVASEPIESYPIDLEPIESYPIASGPVNTEPVNTEPVNTLQEINIDIFDKTDNIWYINKSKSQLRVWDNHQKYKCFFIWNRDKRYNSIFTKIKTGDIMCVYVVGEGFLCICKVTGPPRDATKDDLLNIYANEKHQFHLPWYSDVICIPVEYIATIDPSRCVKHKDIPHINEWSYGYRGSGCIKPSSLEWKTQVKEIYKYMKSSQTQNLKKQVRVQVSKPKC